MHLENWLFPSGVALTGIKHGSIPLSVNLLEVTQFCPVKWEERFAGSFWDYAFSFLGDIHKRSAFLFPIGHKQGKHEAHMFPFYDHVLGSRAERQFLMIYC